MNIIGYSLKEQKQLLEEEAIRLLYRASVHENTVLEYVNKIDLHFTLKKEYEYDVNEVIPLIDLTYVNIMVEDKLRQEGDTIIIKSWIKGE